MDHRIVLISTPAAVNLIVSRFSGEINAHISGDFTVDAHYIAFLQPDILLNNGQIRIILSPLYKSLCFLKCTAFVDDPIADICF